MKRALAVAGIAVGSMLIGYALFARKSDAELIAERLDELERAIQVRDENLLFRRNRLNTAFDRILTKDVRVSVPELAVTTSGRAGVVSFATVAAREYGSLEVDIERRSTEVSGSSAAVVADVMVTSESDQLRHEKREVSFDFVRGDSDGWQISSLRVEAAQ
jgi:hypothetical protein